ncbi:hypothetical protein ACA910_011099 [Epithemia clementina (nom. ined.)]
MRSFYRPISFFWLFGFWAHEANAFSTYIPGRQGHAAFLLGKRVSRSHAIFSTTLESPIIKESNVRGNLDHDNNNKNGKQKIVLVAGFESFNREQYLQAAAALGDQVELQVFADSDIRLDLSVIQQQERLHQSNNEVSASNNKVDPLVDNTINPIFREAVLQADVFVGSLLFDYDDVQAVLRLLPAVKGPRLLFECATELMEFNQVGSFNMKPSSDGSAPGPPPAIKAILSKFGSGKEEDKLAGYIKLLKVGPDLLKFVPGDKAADLRTWLECYRFWNQGGQRNVQSMLQLLAKRSELDRSMQHDEGSFVKAVLDKLPPVQVTPDVGLIHPVRYRDQSTRTTSPFFDSPASYMAWRTSPAAIESAQRQGFKLADVKTAPIVAVLLYRKHVITEQKYILDLLTMMEEQGIVPVPVFINGVEAHTIVRDWLTSAEEMRQVATGKIKRAGTHDATKAVKVDAIVNTIGFPLVGGPAGSMQAGRDTAVAEELLSAMNVPYFVAGPLLLQSIPVWKDKGVLGLNSVVLYGLPELDGAIDTVVLGGLVGDKIALVPERVRKLTSRIKSWVELRKTPPKDRRVAISVYGFPPNVGAVGTAALLDVPHSLDRLLRQMAKQGYDLGNYVNDPDASGESIIAALSVLSEPAVIALGADRMGEALQRKIARAQAGDETVNAALALPGAGLGGGEVVAKDVSSDELEKTIGKYMYKKVRRAWSEKERGPGVSRNGDSVVAGIQIGNVFIFVQPLLGVEGDPMRLLFERDLTPHPQYIATYANLQKRPESAFPSDAIIHFGMHGTAEWLPGQPLGNDKKSWSDELIGALPNLYVYAANNPSESILAKRRGYGTLISHSVPPYGRAGLYQDLALLRELTSEYRENAASGGMEKNSIELCQTIYDTANRCGMLNDVPLWAYHDDKSNAITTTELPDTLSSEAFGSWVSELSTYLSVLQERLFSSGLHVFGGVPSDDALDSYLEAFYGDKFSSEQRQNVISQWKKQPKDTEKNPFAQFFEFFSDLFAPKDQDKVKTEEEKMQEEAMSIVSLLGRSYEEVDSLLNGLGGGYILPKPGGDLLRDGPAVLPTGRNIHALDPYRMPSAGAWLRGQKAAQEIIRQHREANNGKYPETVAVSLWGLDAIKTRGESVAIVLALVGAKPVKEGTGRIVRYDLIPLEELGRPRVDVLASLSGIFRDSFANVVDLLDDMFERAASADEPESMNFIKKHSNELIADGTSERTAARLFSNPPGDFGSMVNEVVGTGDWEDDESLGETWRGRNVYSYGRNERGGDVAGTARPEVLDKLLATTERIVQEVDSVEYGLSDIQEYYANTGALKKAAENRKEVDAATGKRKKVSLSVIEAFGNGGDDNVSVRDVEEVLRLEYRSKLLNPKWRDAMLAQGSGGAYEVSQRMTAMIGWAATAQVDNFVFDQAAERYALDEDVAKQLQRSNPEAFKNVVRRLLEAAGRGMWSTNEDTLGKLRELYAEADDIVEQGSSPATVARAR